MNKHRITCIPFLVLFLFLTPVYCFGGWTDLGEVPSGWDVWASWYWPFHNDYNPNLYDTGEAMDRYDQYDTTANAKTWEYENHGPPQNPAPWWGHCHAWSGAACWEPQPENSKSIEGVIFRIRDKKGLIIEAYDECANGSHYELYENDPSPGLFWRYLRHEIDGQNPMHGHGMAFVGELYYGSAEVWNYPIYKYQITVNDDASPYSGTMTIWVADDSSPSYADSTILNSKTFTYTFSGVVGDGTDPVDSGTWGGSGPTHRPDAIWRPYFANNWMTYTSNPELDEIHLSNIFSSDSDDNYEENDTSNTAYDFTSENTWLSTINGLGSQADDDWYEIYVSPSGHERVQVDCRFTHSTGDIDIQLVNSSGTVLASSTSTSDNEFIDYVVPSTGTYYIRVYYGNAGNTYDLWWDDIYICNAPTSPSIISYPSSDSDGAFTITWSSVSGATSYTLERATNSSFTGATQVYSGTATSYGQSGLANGTYYYRVRANNSCGNSSWRTGSGITINICAVPSTPSSLSYPSSDNDGSFSVSWSSVSGATNYTLERATNSSFTGATQVYSGTATSYGQSGLATGTYYYRVRANNACGSGSWRNGSAVTVCAMPSTPSSITYPPSDSDGAFTITWSSVTGATSYTLERATNSSFTGATQAYSGTATSYGQSGLANGTYYYRVRANNACGSDSWLNGSAVTVCAMPPTPSSITYPPSDSDGAFTITWSSVTGATSYTLERATNSSFTGATQAYSGTATSYGQSGLANGTYYYRLRANNACGSSSWRNGPVITVVNCSYTISPASKSFSAGGGTGSVSVTVPNGCSWTTSENLEWLAITSGSSGSGNGTVTYSVAANTSGSPRNGNITIAGQIHTVTVAPAPSVGLPFLSLLLEAEPETGTIHCAVRDAVTSNMLEGVLVKVIEMSENTVLATATTNSNGSFSMVVPAGSDYRISFTLTGYLEAVRHDVDVEIGDNIYLETLMQIANQYAGQGNITGTVRNALDNSPVSSVTVRLRSGINVIQGATVAQTTTAANGVYAFNALTAGYYTAEFSRSGYVTTFRTVIVIGGLSTPGQDATISPEIGAGETRIVLTWGATPYDLDSHLTGPLPSGERFHIYWDAPWTDNANLDIDDVTSYGPETITITQQINGIYRYSVHDYTNRGASSSNDLSNSGAQVRVFRGNSLVATYNVPQNRGGTLWTIFELTGNTINPVNTLTYEGNPSIVPDTNLQVIRTDSTLFENLPAKD